MLKADQSLVSTYQSHVLIWSNPQWTRRHRCMLLQVRYRVLISKSLPRPAFAYTRWHLLKEVYSLIPSNRLFSSTSPLIVIFCSLIMSRRRHRSPLTKFTPNQSGRISLHAKARGMQLPSKPIYPNVSLTGMLYKARLFWRGCGL